MTKNIEYIKVKIQLKVLHLDKEEKSWDSFEEAIEYSNKSFVHLSLMIMALGEAILAKKKTTREALFETEQTSIKLKKQIQHISKRPGVSSNKDELAFLGVFTKDFLNRHYTIRGMAAEIKDGESVDLEKLKVTAGSIIISAQILQEVISNIFKQKMDELLEDKG